MLVTICTIRQLPQAFVLCHSFAQFRVDAVAEPILIGLVDDLDHLPAGFKSPYSLLPIQDLVPADQVRSLSAIYTPTEFAAACKPLFIAEAFRRYPDANQVLYADPSIQFFAPVTKSTELATDANIVLTPFVTRSPASTDLLSNDWPDEKHFQNIGLYNADFLIFKRSIETDRMLAWWDDRVRERAYINPCAGLWLDQLWLMHVPVFFRNVAIVKNPGWHVGLWNLPERTLQFETNEWVVDGPAGRHQSLQFLNFKGLLNPDEGFFPHQNRVQLTKRPDVLTLLQSYRQAVAQFKTSVIDSVKPAYGQQPEPVVLRGWREATVRSMRAINRFIDRIYLPEIRSGRMSDKR